MSTHRISSCLVSRRRKVRFFKDGDRPGTGGIRFSVEQIKVSIPPFREGQKPKMFKEY